MHMARREPNSAMINPLRPTVGMKSSWAYAMLSKIRAGTKLNQKPRLLAECFSPCAHASGRPIVSFRLCILTITTSLVFSPAKLRLDKLRLNKPRLTN